MMSTLLRTQRNAAAFSGQRTARGRRLPLRGQRRGSDGKPAPAGARGRQRNGTRRAEHGRPQLRGGARGPGELAYVTHAAGLRPGQGWQ